MDQGSSNRELLTGTAIVGIGRDALERFYALTGRPEGAVLRARYDSVRALVDELEQVRGAFAVINVANIRRYWLRQAQDTTQLRGVRMEMFYTLALVPCTNARELIFGPGEDIQAAVAQARRDLLRFPSEEAYLELILESPERAASTDAGLIADDLVSPLILGIARISGWMLRNQRIPGCIALYLKAP